MLETRADYYFFFLEERNNGLSLCDGNQSWWTEL